MIVAFGLLDREMSTFLNILVWMVGTLKNNFLLTNPKKYDSGLKLFKTKVHVSLLSFVVAAA